MKLRAIISACGLLLLFLATTGVKGCREEAARTFNPNRAPDTFLTAAPIESTSTSYLYHLFWNGTDPDGEVVGFYIAVTDSNIEPLPDDLIWTTRTDTNIAFKVAGTTQTLTHRFYVMAVDNEGRNDPSPATVFFESYDRFFPEPVFLDSYAVEYLKDGGQRRFSITDNISDDGIRDTIPVVDPSRADSVITYFRWTGIDKDRFGRVEGFRFRLSGDAGYTDLSGADTAATRYRNLKSGTYSFGLAALDDAGAQTDPDSVRTFVVNFDPDTRFEPTFIERRGSGSGQTEIVHAQGDTVAIGSVCVFCLRGNDLDGDNNAIQYSHGLLKKKSCGGGTNFPFTFFDTDSVGPRYCYELEIDKNPTESGFLRVLARTKDLNGRVDGKPAEFQLYSNLSPTIEKRNVRLNTVYNMTSGFVRASGGQLTVTLSQLTDPDPGTGGGTMEALIKLEGIGAGVSYLSATDWAPSGSAHTLAGITTAGRYRLTLSIRDEGCRLRVLTSEFDIGF